MQLSVLLIVFNISFINILEISYLLEASLLILASDNIPKLTTALLEKQCARNKLSPISQS